MLRDRCIFINILLCIWQIIQIIVGLVMLAIFRNKTKYTNEYNGIVVWRISHKGAFGTACFSTGPFIITVEHPDERLLRHETGHSKQSLYLGPLFHIVVSIPSICRFWVRRLGKKTQEWYLSGYPENWAEKCGGTAELKNKDNNVCKQ